MLHSLLSPLLDSRIASASVFGFCFRGFGLLMDFVLKVWENSSAATAAGPAVPPPLLFLTVGSVLSNNVVFLSDG